MLMPVTVWRTPQPSGTQGHTCERCEVRSDALFGALDGAALERLHTDIAASQLQAEQAVYGRGSPGVAAYTVREGIVRFERCTQDGRRRIVRLAGRGDLVGLEAVLAQPYAEDAVACTPVQLCRLPRLLVDALAGEHAALRQELMRRWQRAVEQAVAWSAELAVGPAPLRMLRLLVLLQRHADDGRVWLPRRDQIADMLDLTVETASRLVSRLRREGVITELLPPRHMRLDGAALVRALAQAER